MANQRAENKAIIHYWTDIERRDRFTKKVARLGLTKTELFERLADAVLKPDVTNASVIIVSLSPDDTPEERQAAFMQGLATMATVGKRKTRVESRRKTKVK